MPIGNLSNFNLATGSWSTYTERLQQYFVVNDVRPALRVATLIACIDDATYELMVDLCSPRRPVDFNYADLVELVRKHLQPTPLILQERCVFRQRTQGDHENVIQYAEALKKLAKHCRFKNSYDENLRDQFVFGLKSEVIKKMLFCEEDLNFATALNKAVALEMITESRENEVLRFKPKLIPVVRKINKQQYKALRKHGGNKDIHDHKEVVMKREPDTETQRTSFKQKRERRSTQRFGIDYSVTYNFKNYKNDLLNALD